VELHNFYASPNIFRVKKSSRMSWEGHLARTGEMTNAYKILVDEPERNLGRPHRWEGVDWIHLVQVR
jgi:hypothetical protein